jgi:hypothetical protein
MQIIFYEIANVERCKNVVDFFILCKVRKSGAFWVENIIKKFFITVANGFFSEYRQM